MSLKNLKLLHIIRGLAALCVMVAHLRWPFWIGGAQFSAGKPVSERSFWDQLGFGISLLTSNATAMVIVFFVLSGFMISHSYQKNKWAYSQFLVNRSLRIYIPYIASALCAIVLLMLSWQLASEVFLSTSREYHQSVTQAHEHGLTPANFIQTLFFYRSDANYIGFNYVYWSLLYEMVFYLLFPLILKYHKQLLVLSICLYPLHFFYEGHGMKYFYVWFLIQYLFYFVAGVWFYQLVTSTNFKTEKFYLFRKPVLALSVPALFGLTILTGLVLPKGVSFFIAVVMCLLWILYILKYGTGKSIFSRVFVLAGEMSFSLYLIHIPIILFAYSFLYSRFGWSTYPSPWGYWLLVPLILVLAYGFYMIFEKFSFRLIEKHKKATHREESAPAALQADKVF